MIGYRLSRTGLASRPFYIRSAGINLWSVEELCFFLSENAALIDDTVAGTPLTRWLTEEFGLTRTALQMERGLRDGGVRGFLMPLFQSTEYLSPAHLGAFMKEVKELASANETVRLTRKADALLKNGRCGAARRIYRRLWEEAGEEDAALAHVFRNSGVAAVRMLEYEEGIRDFRRALRIRESPEVLRLLLIALKLSKPEAKYCREAEALGADEALLTEVDRVVRDAYGEAVAPPEDLRHELDEIREQYHREAGN